MKKTLFFVIALLILLTLCACNSKHAPENPTPLTPHTHSYISKVEQSSCLVEGKTIYTCECGDTYSEPIAPRGAHEWSDWTIIKESTYTEEGEEVIHCIHCGEVQFSLPVEMKPLRVLFIGNSFSLDTTNLAPQMAYSLGMENVNIAVLYVGGCSIKMHYDNFVGAKADYTYYEGVDASWTTTRNYSIQRALEQEEWDYICIQHGTGDGSRYSRAEDYSKLAALVKLVKETANEDAVIAFNTAWVMEPDSTHEEIISYGGDQLRMFDKVTETLQACVEPVEGIEVVIPTTTAVQNARTVVTRELTRDKFHLSYDLGRYIAAMTLLKGLCGIETDHLEWLTYGVSEEEREMAKKAVNAALANPYAITDLTGK